MSEMLQCHEKYVEGECVNRKRKQALLLDYPVEQIPVQLLSQSEIENKDKITLHCIQSVLTNVVRKINFSKTLIMLSMQ